MVVVAVVVAVVVVVVVVALEVPVQRECERYRYNPFQHKLSFCTCMPAVRARQFSMRPFVS